MSFIYTTEGYEVRRILLLTNKKINEKDYCFNTFKSRSTGEFTSSISKGNGTSYPLARLENK